MNAIGVIIAYAVKLTETLEGICQLFDEVTDLITAEHDLIKVSDLNGIEKITREKVDLGAKVEASCNDLANVFDNLKESLVDHGLLSSGETIDLGSLVNALDLVEADQDSTEGKLLHHSKAKLVKYFGEFKEKRASYQPLIEMNQYLIKKLLEHHRETYRFWQSIATESEATYGDKGQSKGGKPQPVIQVKT